MKIFKTLYPVLAFGAVLSLTGCIDEVLPEEEHATEEQMKDAGLVSAVNGMSSQFCQGYLVYDGKQVHETDMAYPQFMIAFTEMLGDMYPGGSNSSYDWYRTYNTTSGNMGPSTYFSYLPWRTLYMFVKSANDAIKTYKGIADPNTDDKNYAAMAYGYRAYEYYLLMVLFEPVENEYTDVKSVLGLTVPIVTDETTEAEANNNPRVSHDEMVKFILSDLETAEKLFTETGYTAKTHTAPDLSVIKALQAKVYLWDGKYAEAYAAADEAIKLAEDNGAAMMTQSELTSANSAFTAATSGWLWYTHYSAENMSNLCNFVGWMSGEADWGYSSLTCPMIDRSLYEKMGINDYRRKQFLDPDRKRGDYETCRDEDFLADSPDYLALKFRCAGGDYQTYSKGGAVDVPIMRLEELYLLRAEAAGMSKGVATGVDLLNKWVTTYRDPAYKCKASTERDMQLAVLDQMRLEFWGEGNAFPSAKRIKPGVMQYYEGTNAPANIFYINARGIKPDWTLVIPQYELDSNKALVGYNNPNPGQVIDGTKAEKGKYADGKYATGTEK